MLVRAFGSLVVVMLGGVQVARAGAVAPLTPDQAAAQATAAQAALTKAEALEQAAVASQQLTDFEACGAAYVDAANALGIGPRADEALYDGAVCYATGGSVGPALQAFAQLRQRFPTSALFGDATQRSARLYAQLGMVDRAAPLLREYGLRSAGAADAPDALADAVYYFRVLGQADDAIATTKEFIGTYGKTLPAKAAEAFFTLESFYAERGDDDGRIEHLRQYLKQYATVGGADNVLVAYATIADLLWKASCPVKLIDGVCAKRGATMPVAKRGAVATRCGQAVAGAAPRWPVVAPSTMPDVPVTRDARHAKEAIAAATKAVAVWDDARKVVNKDRVRAAYAGALVLLADAAFEATGTPAFPTGLNFDAARPELAKQSMQRFDAWFAAAQRTSTEARAAYQRVFDARDAAAALTASARIGDLSRSFARTLQTAEIPAAVRKVPEAAAAYCDALEHVVQPVTQAATEAYTLTLTKSTQLGLWTEASRHAEAALGLAPPAEHLPAMRVAPSPTDLEVPEYAARSLDAVTPPAP